MPRKTKWDNPPLPPPGPVAGGTKHDEGKLRWDLLPAWAIEEVIAVYTFGANKYADRNWEKGFKWSRLFAACMRHMWAFWRGEDKDPESGLSHLSHAAFCVLSLLHFKRFRPDLDDRPRYEMPKE